MFPAGCTGVSTTSQFFSRWVTSMPCGKRNGCFSSRATRRPASLCGPRVWGMCWLKGFSRGSKATGVPTSNTSRVACLRFGTWSLVQNAAARVLLQGACVKVFFARLRCTCCCKNAVSLWNLVAGAASGCRCKVLSECRLRSGV